MNAVLDASVAMKWVLEEPGSAAAAAWLEEDVDWAAPDLLLAEAGNVLWKRVVRAEIAADIAESCLQVLAAAPIRLLSSRDLIRDALRVSVRLGQPVYDGLYVAAALDLDCPLVTADGRLAAALTAAGLGSIVRLVGAGGDV